MLRIPASAARDRTTLSMAGDTSTATTRAACGAAAAALVRDRLPPGGALADLGRHRLRDLGRPEQIFQLSAPGLQAEFPPLRSLGNPTLPNNLPSQLALRSGLRRPRPGVPRR